MKTLVLGSLAVLVTAPAVVAQNFASSVTATTREIFIGQPLNQYSPGLVHIYRRAADGSWRHGAELKAANGHALDRFGRSISVDGDRLLVGSTSIDQSTGAGYIFERDRAGTWTERAKLVPAGAAQGDSWGRHVLMAGDVAYIAAWGAREGRGVVSVWTRSDGGAWVEGAPLTASDAAPGDFFGTGIAVLGDLLVVGASQRDSAKGQAYVYRRTAAGGWQEEARLTGRALTRFAGFGSAVAIDGDRILVGAPGANSGAGLVYSYSRDGGTWGQTAEISAFDGARGGQFGSALQLVGGEIWIGAPGADNTGRVYRLARDPSGGFSSASRLALVASDRGDAIGAVFAAAGDAAVVGAPGDDLGAGTAFILSKGTAGAWSRGVKVFTEEKELAAVTGSKRECGTAGKVAAFDCDGVDLQAFLPVSAIGGSRGTRLNDIWGWTDPQSGREYALVGRVDGTSFVDVTDPANPRYLGDMPKTDSSPAAGWRDIKVYKDHAFVVADGSAFHGMQVFDLTHLRNLRGPPRVFKPDVWYDKIASAHNIVIDTASGFAFAVGVNGGGETCGGALHMINIQEPKQPRFAGCFADPSTGNQRTGYTHDSQCVVYQGPDQTYTGRQICFNSSETAIGIGDVTDKTNPKALSRAAYPNVGYTHQGWLTEDQRFFYVNDEGDEVSGTVKGTRTLIWDVSDLDDPVLAGEYISDNPASDHNLYVKGNLMYQSNYASGLRVFDVSDPKNPKPVGFFDTNPVGADAPGFTGSWSNYPFFKSGTIVVSSIQEGLFILKKADRNLIP